MSDVWCPECEVTFRRDLGACPSCGWLPPAVDDYRLSRLGQLSQAARVIAKLGVHAEKVVMAAAAREETLRQLGKEEHSPEVQRLHRIAEALGVMNYHDSPHLMEREIMKALCQPLFLAICEDRHVDDWYALFRDPDRAKEWLEGQLQEQVAHYTSEDHRAQVIESERGVDFFAKEDHWTCAFHTFEEGPKGRVQAIPSPMVQEGGE